MSNVTVSAALPPLSSTPDIGNSLPPITSSLPKPDGGLSPPEPADQGPSETTTPVISYNVSSASEQLSKTLICIISHTLILAVSMLYRLYHCTFNTGNSLPPIISSSPKPNSDLTQPESADQGPSEAISHLNYNESSA
uniref:Uncharacterized protein n=1 Tax=Daucus carota subsp. sativus TaxID=79200 RepID=A0A175YP18_DAUCS